MKRTEIGGALLPAILFTTLMAFIIMALWEMVGLYQSINIRSDRAFKIEQSIALALKQTESSLLAMEAWPLTFLPESQLTIHLKNSLSGNWWRSEPASEISFWKKHGIHWKDDTSNIEHYMVIEHYHSACDTLGTLEKSCVHIFRVTINSLINNYSNLLTQAFFSRR